MERKNKEGVIRSSIVNGEFTEKSFFEKLKLNHEF